ncbi:MAG TPA: tetratricopeptide repeat protein [Pyrinomonadaceae bacterium]
MKKLLLLFVLPLVSAVCVLGQDRTSQDRWENYYGAGMRALNAGDLAKAELLFKASRLKAELEQEAGHPKALEMRLDSNNAISVVLRAQGKSAEAEEVLQEQLDLLTASKRPENDPHISMTLHNLGLVLFDQRKYDDARKILERTVDLRRKYDPEPQRNVAISLLSLGGTYFHQGSIDQGEKLILEARRILAEIPDEKKTVDDQAAVMRSDHNLGLIYVSRKKYVEAEASYKRAIATMEKLYGPNTRGLVMYLNNYAVLLKVLKRDSEAKALEARAEMIQKREQ